MRLIYVYVQGHQCGAVVARAFAAAFISLCMHKKQIFRNSPPSTYTYTTTTAHNAVRYFDTRTLSLTHFQNFSQEYIALVSSHVQNYLVSMYVRIYPEPYRRVFNKMDKRIRKIRLEPFLYWVLT